MEALTKIVARFNTDLTGTGLPFLMAVIFIVLILNIAAFYLRRKKRLFQGLANFLNGRAAPGFFKPTFRGLHDGMPLVIEHLPGQENIPERLRITLERITPFRMTIRPCGDFPPVEPTGKELFPGEVRTGNPEFDTRFRVYSGDVWPVTELLSRGEVQEAVKALFSLDYEELEIGGNAVRLEKSSGDLKILAADLYLPRLSEVLGKLSLLARNIPPGGMR